MDNERILTEQIKKLGVDVQKVMRLIEMARVAERDKAAVLESIRHNKQDVLEATEAIRQQAQYLCQAIDELMRIHGGPWPDDNDDDFLRDNPVLTPLRSPRWLFHFDEALRTWMQEHIPAAALDGLSKAIAACEAQALQSSGISHFRENAEYKGPEIPKTLRDKDLSETTVQVFAEIASILKDNGHAAHIKKTADLFQFAGIDVDTESIRKRLRRRGRTCPD